MSRLRHPVKSYIATLRMTRFKLVVFIEGKDNDPIFYGAVIDRMTRETGDTVDLRRADELPNAADGDPSGAGGKLTLQRAAKFWWRWKHRDEVGWTQDRRVFFCIDRDAEEDEATDKERALVRTRHHSVENHLVNGTDLAEALAIAFSARTAEIEAELPYVATCASQFAALWKEWTTFCLLAKRLDVGVGGYGRSSPINNPAHAATSASLMSSQLEILRKKAGIGAPEFGVLWVATTEEVDRLIAAGQFDRVFKGKWYGDILFSIFSSGKLATQCKNTGKNGIWIGIRARFTLRDEDYDYYRGQLA